MSRCRFNNLPYQLILGPLTRSPLCCACLSAAPLVDGTAGQVGEKREREGGRERGRKGGRGREMTGAGRVTALLTPPQSKLNPPFPVPAPPPCPPGVSEQRAVPPSGGVTLLFAPISVAVSAAVRAGRTALAE